MIDSAMPLVATCAALYVYCWTFVQCGRARAAHKIAAPATTGHPEFERAFRIQQNTVEQIMLFLPSLWLFAEVASSFWGGVIGLAWSVGRILYGIGYQRSPELRGPGFLIALAANVLLLLGGTIGVVRLLLPA
jgi:glutathione S-transferase